MSRHPSRELGDADGAFTRYRQHGDPADLAEVFDRTAPRLILVAMHLMRDVQEAEDLLQTTFLEAIRHKDSFQAGRPVLPWLMKILARKASNRRAQRARRREQPLPEGVAHDHRPEPFDSAAHNEVLDRVSTALEQMPKPYREVLVLRLVNGLRPIEISRALDRPAGTVHAQIHRGLEMLREALPKGIGIPAALLLSDGRGLAAVRTEVLSAATAGTSAVTIALGGLVMKKLVVTVCCVVLASLGFSVWYAFARGEPERPGLDTSGGASTDVPSAAADSPVGHDAASTHGARTELVETSVARKDNSGPPTTGSLSVTILWSDETPAADIAVHVAHLTPYRILQRKLSDSRGRVRFDRVPTGAVNIGTDRGAERREVELRPGSEQEVRIVLDPGVDVEGTVCDDAGRPVTGAGIWLTAPTSRWIGGRVVTHADDNGSFRLRSAPHEQSLGALAPGFAPSELVDLELLDSSEAPVRVRLVLDKPGGALAGQVVDPRGRGAEGALIAVGSAGSRSTFSPSGRTIESWTPRIVAVGGEGAYRLDGLPPGTHPVEVWAKPYPFWCGKCEIVAGETARLDIELEDGVTVHGVVRGADRASLSGAVVRAFPVAIEESLLPLGQYDHESVFGYAHAIADATGRYSLERAAPGSIHLYAAPGTHPSGGGAVTWDSALLRGSSGDVLEWNPVLDPGATIEGVVLYRDGSPVRQGVVFAIAQGEDERNPRNFSVHEIDRTGRFRIVRLENVAYEVRVQVWPGSGDERILRREGVWPGREFLRFQLDDNSPREEVPGTVRGRVVDAGGRLRAQLAVILRSARSGGRRRPQLNGSTFRFERVPPGRYRVVVLSGDDPVYCAPWFDLSAAEDRDVGTLVTAPGGVLVVDMERTAGTENVEPRIVVRHENGTRRVMEVGRQSECRLENLCTGTHRVWAQCSDAAASALSCQVVAGDATRVTIQLRRALRREMVIEFPEDEVLDDVAVTDTAGTLFVEFEFARPATTGELRWRPSLPVGEYVLRAETRSGTAGRIPFAIASLEENLPAVVLTLD